MPDRRTRGGAVASVIITVLVLAGLAIAALVATGFYVARHVRVTEKDARGVTTVETPFGTVRVRENSKLDPKHLGVPVYPGAVREDDSRKLASFRFDFGHRHKEFSIVAAEYRTSDPLDKVAEFYRHELPHWIFNQSDHGGMQIELTEGGYKKIVAIHRDGDETRIGLASVGEPASN